MTGYLTQTLGEWMVKHGEGKDQKIYPLCSESQKWIQNPNTQKFLKENIEVVFDFIVKGEYCETKEQMIKNYFVKIKQVEHSSL